MQMNLAACRCVPDSPGPVSRRGLPPNDYRRGEGRRHKWGGEELRCAWRYGRWYDANYMNTCKTGGKFPERRLRRLRRVESLRDAVADVRLNKDDLVCPVFVGDFESSRPVASMPGVEQQSVKDAVDRIREQTRVGLRQFVLFGVTHENKKDATGSYAAHEDAPVNRVLKSVRDAGIEAVMYADLCLCEYTGHGHCGVLDNSAGAAETKVEVDNDRTLDVLGRVACVLASSGADVVAPSGMMDGQVGTVRRALDDNGHGQVAILSYSIKYASSLYGPFRDAGGGDMKFGDRRGYQMDYRRSREWQAQLNQDLAQGADMVMVKPAGAYLDIVRQVRDACSVPVGAYHVSGEYSMMCAAAERGWLDLKEAALEVTHGIKRAGADVIVTYFAPQLVGWI